MLIFGFAEILLTDVISSFVEGHTEYILRVRFQGREPHSGDGVACVFSTGLCSDAYEPTSFKLDIYRHDSLHSLIRV